MPSCALSPTSTPPTLVLCMWPCGQGCFVLRAESAIWQFGNVRVRMPPKAAGLDLDDDQQPLRKRQYTSLYRCLVVAYSQASMLPGFVLWMDGLVDRCIGRICEIKAASY